MFKRVIPFSLLLCSLTLQAEVQTQDVVYKIDDEEFTAYLAYDDAIKEPRPGVLVFPQWWGLSDYEKGRARMLAEMGYVALAVDMYGTGKLTDEPEQAKTWMQAVTADKEWWRERALKAMEILRGQKQVAADDVAAIGYCFGGGTVLQAAYAGADLDGVVSFHGSLPAADEEEANRIVTPLLVLNGGDDPFVSDEVQLEFQQKLEQNPALDWQIVTYGGARHSFTDPGADKRDIPALKYDAKADQRSWRAMRHFLQDVFAD